MKIKLFEEYENFSYGLHTHISNSQFEESKNDSVPFSNFELDKIKTVLSQYFSEFEGELEFKSEGNVSCL